MTTPPAKCQLCGFSSRHTRQQPGEKLEYRACCHAWMCAACREARGCTGHSDEAVIPGARSDQPPGVPPNDGIYSRVPEEVYHGDPTSLSSSGARTLVNTTAEQFYYELHQPPKPKPQYDFGHAAHKMVLGEGGQIKVLDPAVHGLKEDGKPSLKPTATAMWKKAEAKARAEGKAVITKEQMKTAQLMAGRVFEHPLAAKLMARGSAEMSGYWHDDETKVRLRFRADWITDGLPRTICVDYKSAISANPRHFERSVFDYGYHQQQAWYEDGLAEMGITDVGFLFIVQQKTQPFSVSVCQIKPEHVELGRQLNRKAVRLFAECESTGVWPGFEPVIHEVGLSNWQVARTEERISA